MEEPGGAGARVQVGGAISAHLHHSALQRLCSPSAAAAAPQYSQEFEEEEQKEFEEEQKEGGPRPVCPEERSPHAGPPSASGTVDNLQADALEQL